MAVSSVRASAGSASGRETAQSKIRLPLTEMSGPPTTASRRSTGLRPSAFSRRIARPAAMGMTSTGNPSFAQSTGTSFSGLIRMTCRREAAATIRSRTKAAPRPLTRSRWGDTSSAPSTVRSSSVSSVMSMSGISSERASRSDASDVGTPHTFSPRRARAPIAAMNADEARPEPSPRRAPSVTSSAARVAAARTPGSVAAPGVPLAVLLSFIERPILNWSWTGLGLVSGQRSMPAADVGGEARGVGRSPGAGLVLVNGGGAGQDGVDDRPGRLDAVLAREQRRVPRHRIAQEALVGVHLVGVGLVHHLQLGRLRHHLLARLLDPRAERDDHLGAQAETEVVGLLGTEPPERRTLERDHDLRRRDRHALAGADEERDTVPAPGVDVQADGREGLHCRVGCDAVLVEIADELPAHEIPRVERPNGAKDLDLLVANRFGVGPDRRLHRQKADHLQQVVLDDVADGARLLVEPSAPLDAEALRHRDLHALDVVPVPDRLEERVGKPEQQEVLHRLLAEVVIDPEDRRFVESGVQRPVERPRRRQIAAERLLDHQPGPLGGAAIGQPTDHCPEDTGGNRQVMGGAGRLAQLAPQRREGGPVSVVAAHIAEAAEQLADHRLVELLDVLLQAVAGAGLK